MATWVEWHGTQREQEALELAVRRNCTCDPDGHVTCPGHHMLDEDQRTLDRLVFMRRMLADRLWRQEMHVQRRR